MVTIFAEVSGAGLQNLLATGSDKQNFQVKFNREESGFSHDFWRKIRTFVVEKQEIRRKQMEKQKLSLQSLSVKECLPV
jgi:hypothetical protein